MATALFQYNGDQVIDHAHTLSKIHRAALPNAVRFTLNDVAFDVKKDTLQKSAKDSFIQRSPSFFRKFSGVDKATGFNMQKMSSSVGMLIDPNVESTKEMAVQETGGSLNRKKVMLPKSRVSGSGQKTVQRRYRAKANFNRKAVRSEEFVKAAFAAEKKKFPENLRYIDDSGKGFMIEISGIRRMKRSGELKIKSKLVGTFKDDRRLSIPQTKFVENASLQSAQHLNKIFRKNAEKQLKKYTK